MPSLDFKGKQFVHAHHLTVAVRPLEVAAGKSLPPDGETPALGDNLIIHGDNLHVLKALLPHYAGKVNCIYIDPPYNTGKEGWAYNDNVNSPLMQEWLKDKSPVDGEDLERHAKWLCMMWPRLQLLKELLAEDGAIFISIDDNEQHHLRMMMDEIFGGGNFVANLTWWSKYTLSNDASNVSYQHENILFYTKAKSIFRIGLLERTTQMDAAYRNPDNDPRGKWKSTPLHAKSGRESDRYTMEFPNGVIWECPVGRFPRYKRSTLLDLYNTGQLYFGASGKRPPNKKTYLSEVKKGKTVGSLWRYDEVGSTHESNEEIAEIFGKGKFDNPKGTKLLRRIIQVANVKSGSLILDSFAGSGTTAHAVLALNREDGGNRRFILVECEDYADNITAERVRRVIKGVPKAKDEALKNGLGGSFTYCTLGNEISVEAMLTGDGLPDYETLARHIYWTATGRSLDSIRNDRGPDGLFYETKDRIYYLIYEPSLDFLRSNESALNNERAERIAEQVQAKKKGAIAFATHKFMGQKELTKMRIEFCGLPYGL